MKALGRSIFSFSCYDFRTLLFQVCTARSPFAAWFHFQHGACRSCLDSFLEFLLQQISKLSLTPCRDDSVHRRSGCQVLKSSSDSAIEQRLRHGAEPVHDRVADLVVPAGADRRACRSHNLGDGRSSDRDDGNITSVPRVKCLDHRRPASNLPRLLIMMGFVVPRCRQAIPCLHDGFSYLNEVNGFDWPSNLLFYAVCHLFTPRKPAWRGSPSIPSKHVF